MTNLSAWPDFSAWPNELEVLRRLHGLGWTVHHFGAQDQPPVAMAAVRRWQQFADVVVVRGRDRAAAYRTLADDALRAELVIWHCLGEAQTVLRAVFDLPAHYRGESLYRIPEQCRVPKAERRRVQIFPPRIAP